MKRPHVNILTLKIFITRKKNYDSPTPLENVPTNATSTINSIITPINNTQTPKKMEETSYIPMHNKFSNLMDYESNFHDSDSQTVDSRDKHSLSPTPSITPKLLHSPTKLATRNITRGNPLACTNTNPNLLYHSMRANHEPNTYPKEI